MSTSAGKYLVVFLFSGGMFFLGVLVGRGNAPVRFDVKTFQEKAAAIVTEIQANKIVSSKPDLVFYDVLKKPVRTGGVNASNEAGEILAAKDGESGALWKEKSDSSPSGAKRSRKSMTLNPEAIRKSRTENPRVPPSDPGPVIKAEKAGASEAAEPSRLQKTSALRKIQEKTKPPSDLKPTGEHILDKAGNREGEAVQERYSIQVAAFRDIKDAITQVDLLQTKGYDTYRVIGSVGNAIWHRVRVGPFSDKKSADSALKRLERDGLNGILLEKE